MAGERVSRRVAVQVVVLMLLVPVLYVALSHGDGVIHANAVSAAAPVKDIAQLERVVASDPSVANRIGLSMEYINGGAPGRAVPVLKTLLEGDPKNVIAWNNLCVAYMGLQELNHAVDACEMGVRLDSSMQLLRNNLMWARDVTAKTTAEIATETHKQRDHRDAASYMAEGIDRLHLGEYGEAEAAWYQCLAIDRRNALAQNDIGVALMMMNKPDEAVVSFGKAVDLDRATALYKNNLAWAQSAK